MIVNKEEGVSIVCKACGDRLYLAKNKGYDSSHWSPRTDWGLIDNFLVQHGCCDTNDIVLEWSNSYGEQ